VLCFLHTYKQLSAVCHVVIYVNSYVIIFIPQVYVVECVGIHVVGYITMTYGSSGTLGNFVTGKLLGLLPYDLVVIGNCVIHFGIMLLNIMKFINA